MYLYMPLFGSHGDRFFFDPDGLYSYSNIFIGDNVNLGYRPIILADRSRVEIGDGVMFGPEVVLVGGGHNVKVVGKFMIDVHEKTGNEDLGVVIKEDVWIGARSIILRGVEVGRGAVVAAASVVTKSVPPYSVVAGNPARVISFRFDVDEIVRHESIMYKPGSRIPRENLADMQAKREMLPPLRRSAL